MEHLQKIVLLIDADNTQLSKMEAVIREISTYGRIVVKRAYGNWKKESLKNWENELKRLAIKAEQQFDYVSGKNATDMALVIDTMNLLHRDIYDAFAIVASDSDYTPLAICLHESGVYVIGIGEKKTPKAFRNSCDDFIFLENLGSGSSPEPEQELSVREEMAAPAKKPRTKKTEKPEKAEKSEKTEKAPEREDKSFERETDSLEEIHNLLRIAYDTYQDDNGFVHVGAAGSFIKRAKPDFDSRTYGYRKLTQLLEAFPDKYRIKRITGKGSVVFAYQCI